MNDQDKIVSVSKHYYQSSKPFAPVGKIDELTIIDQQPTTNKMSRPMGKDIQDTEEYVEEALSLNDVERNMITKVLEKHHGKRKPAAKELNISERTLYRKIKEYGLD